MSGINVCTFLGGNTGEGSCEVRMSSPKFFGPTRGLKFSKADLASSDTVKAAMLAAMLLSREDDNKLFWFPVLRKISDNTAEAKTETLDDGFEEVLNESLPSYLLESTAGVCQTQGMVAFNGWTGKNYVIDKNNILWAVATDDGGAQGWSTGSLYTNPPRFGNSSNINTNKTKLVFGTVEEFKGKLIAVKLNFDPTKLANIVDVALFERIAATGYAFKIASEQYCAGTDLYAAYKTGLAQTGAWDISLPDGTAVTVASVAADDTNKAWTVTAASSPTIAAGVKLTVKLKNPTVLAGLTTPVKGIESIPVVVTKP